MYKEHVFAYKMYILNECKQLLFYRRQKLFSRRFSLLCVTMANTLRQRLILPPSTLPW